MELEKCVSIGNGGRNSAPSEMQEIRWCKIMSRTMAKAQMLLLGFMSFLVLNWLV